MKTLPDVITEQQQHQLKLMREAFKYAIKAGFTTIVIREMELEMSALIKAIESPGRD